MAHVIGVGVAHPELPAVRERRAAFMEVGFKGSEEPTEAEPTPEQRSSSAHPSATGQPAGTSDGAA